MHCHRVILKESLTRVMRQKRSVLKTNDRRLKKCSLSYLKKTGHIGFFLSTCEVRHFQSHHRYPRLINNRTFADIARREDDVTIFRCIINYQYKKYTSLFVLIVFSL